MKIGIVGSSKAQDSISVPFIIKLMKEYPEDTTFVSGGANGIDCGVRVACDILDRELVEYLPKINEWIGGYRERNMLIASSCDEVISITLPFQEDGIQKYCYHCKSKRHQKTAGCWTARKCKKFRIVVLDE